MMKKYTSKNISDVLHKGINLVHHGVETLDPENNRIFTTHGEEYTYDYLVVASGLELRWD